MSISSTTRAQQSSVVTRPKPFSLALWGWIIWEAGRLPYLLTVCTFVFLPYIAASLADNAVAVQIRFAGYSSAAGLAMALTLPVLVICIDRKGYRKPFLIATTLSMVLLLTALWWVKPAGPIASNGGLLIVALLNLLYGYGELIHHSMSPALADATIGSRLSSITLAIGNMATVFVLGIVFCELLWPQMPGAPFAAQRVTGPVVAALLVVTALPLVVWTPEPPRSEIPIKDALHQMLGEFGEVVRRILSDRAALRLLVARTCYIDGVMALMQFGGIFAAGVSRARTPDRLAIAMLLVLGGALGALLAGNLEALLGPRRIMRIGTGVLSVWLLARLGKRLFALLLPSPLVAIFYLALAILGSSAFAGALFASRVVIGRPASRVGACALSGAATAWLGPLLIGVSTAMFHSQVAGIIPAVFLLGGGLVGMSLARSD